MVQNEEVAVLMPVQEKADLRMTALRDFTPLVQSHQQRIYRVLLGMVRDPDAAQTLTQECFLKAYQKRASFRGEASVGIWLLKPEPTWKSRMHRCYSRFAGFSPSISGRSFATCGGSPRPPPGCDLGLLFQRLQFHRLLLRRLPVSKPPRVADQSDVAAM